MKINERDLFNFVFSKGLLDKEKAEYIKVKNLFNEEIFFLKSLKNASSEKITPDSKRKIAQKIPSYKYFGTIELYPEDVKKIKLKFNKSLLLAADSAELKPQNTSQTFIDENKNYLIKLISSETESKIFVFSTKEELLYNLNITLEPQHIKFHMNDNSKPLELNEAYDVQKIKLELID